MIRVIRTKNLAALREGAELAFVLNEELAAREAADEQTAASHRQALYDQAELNQQLVLDLDAAHADLAAARSQIADLDRLKTLLLDAVQQATDAADAPIVAVLHEGKVQSLHRDRASAKAATPFADRTWKLLPAADPEPLGWKIWSTTPPPLARPDCADEVAALLIRLARPETERAAEAAELQQLKRELETVREQRDTAVEDTETAATAYTAEALAHALYRAGVAEVTAQIVDALSAGDPAASIRAVSRLLLKHAEDLGIDLHGTGDGAVRINTNTKGSAA